jgi:hypothetical protein
MRTGRIAILLATIAFSIVVAFQFTTVFSTAQLAHSPNQTAAGISQPNSGLPYN